MQNNISLHLTKEEAEELQEIINLPFFWNNEPVQTVLNKVEKGYYEKFGKYQYQLKRNYLIGVKTHEASRN